MVFKSLLWHRRTTRAVVSTIVTPKATFAFTTTATGNNINLSSCTPSVITKLSLGNNFFVTASASLSSSGAVAALPLPNNKRRRGSYSVPKQQQQQDATKLFSTTTTSNNHNHNHNSTNEKNGTIRTKTPPTTFDDGNGPFQITTPIYYVNDKPHIGHAYTSIACDVIARYMRLSGREVFFLSGTDEHGTKIAQSAAKKGIDPQLFVDTVSLSFQQLLQALHISHDHFIRTTQPDHQLSVQHLWEILVQKGYIYLGTYEGWYSVRDECFYNASEIIDGKAPTGADDLEYIEKEKSYFFKLTAFEQKLLTFYEEHPDFIAPLSKRKEVLAFIKGGLHDISVSRTSCTWGIPVPNDDQHIIYVWIDALTNYISALGYPPNHTKTHKSNDTEEDETSSTSRVSNFEKFWPASLHIVGKDILRFHAVYWIAILMAADIPTPKRLFAHGWWTMDGEKMSKSLGNTIDPFDIIEKYGVDQTRFFLMSEVALGNDGDFSTASMIQKCNNNLANELGNLCQRTLSMVYKNCDQAVPTPTDYTPEDLLLLTQAQQLQTQCGQAVSKQELQKYIQLLIAMVWETNRYVNDMEPWELHRTQQQQRMETVLYVVMEVLRYVSILYQPIIPTSSQQLLDTLTVPPEERHFDCLTEEYRIKPGSPLLQKPQGIFPRLSL